MASTHRAPKQWCLTKHETINSFENWKQNLIYTLSLDSNFAPFLAEGVTWLKKTKAQPTRGFQDDGSSVPTASRLTARQKVNFLELMLGQIANYCPIISRSSLVKNSTSLEFIWQTIRQHFGFQVTGAHFIDFADVHLEPNERPEDLYQRLMAFVEDSLLKTNGLTHHGDAMTEDEELSPTLENLIVLTWLKLIHPQLPKLVKQRYGTELRSRTLASIKPEISQALDSLLDEIHTTDDAKVLRSAVSTELRRNPAKNRPGNKTPRQGKTCPLCKQAGRPEFRHFLSHCEFLPESDKRYMVKARQIVDILDDEQDDEIANEPDSVTQLADSEQATARALAFRVQTRQSPYLDVFHGHHTTRIVIDSGATGNMIRRSTAQRLGVKVTPSSQSVHQADGASALTVVGETQATFTRNNHTFQFEGLVIEDLDVEVLAGTPFMEANDVAVRPARREVLLGDGSSYQYGSQPNNSNSVTARYAFLLRAPPSTQTVWPGEFLELELPPDAPSDYQYAIEPRTDAPVAKQLAPTELWPQPCIVSSVARRIRIPNLTSEPLTLKRNEHLCQATLTYKPDDTVEHTQPTHQPQTTPTNHSHSSTVQIDPSNLLPADVQAEFQSLLKEYDTVFDPKFPGYNGAAGPFQAKVNMGPVEPPQRKGRLPQYNRGKLVQLQEKFDQLEELGVFARPEEVGITAEYLNPSFLVKKANGGHRLVTAFADVGRYSKPQPSLLPDVDTTLRHIAQWKHLIKTDLTSAFYQIPLAKESMKYCGVATPFKGVRIYQRSAMGMPGSETALEELMCRVLGTLLHEGAVVKIADDLYCGGDTPQELLLNWRRLLHALHRCDLRLSASKTVINPKETTILGWIWSSGTLTASPHRVNTLSSCPAPNTVGQMRSFIGAYKVLSRVIPQCSNHLAPLDDAIAGRQSQETILWTDDLTCALQKSQHALRSTHRITLPKPSDQLWIVTDRALRNPGIGATLYITQEDKLFLAGFFSAKLRGLQTTWLPCEIEALSIAAATKHFSPFIIQSNKNTCILTDSKPCVQAFEKLCRGEFSASPRVSTFLSVVSRYQASVRHVAGTAILPSDFASRNAPPCENESCQVCTFVNDTRQSVVRMTSINDVIEGRVRLPFTSRSAWLSIQTECPDLRRTHAHLLQGTRPSKKLTHIKDVKRYLNVATVASDGLLVVKRNEPLVPTKECIIVPRQALDGLLTALHIQLHHPTCHQLKMVAKRYLYALDMDKAVDRVTSGCHTCAALKQSPSALVEQSTSPPPDTVGQSFAADVIQRSRQRILVLRETITSYTATLLLKDERHTTLRDGLILLCIQLRPMDGPHAIIRTDPAPGLKALVDDKLLKQYRITIELGRAKNPNKNPVAEKAIQELEFELLRQDPLGGTVTDLDLAVATATLNSRIRSRGLSSREMLTQRDQFTNAQIPISDDSLLTVQHQQRLKNHPFSEESKAHSNLPRATPTIAVGDLVYLHSDRNKSRARDRYLVVSMDPPFCNIQKFVGTQLRSASYRVKITECFKVPADVCISKGPARPSFIDDAEEEVDEAVAAADDTVTTDPPPAPPPIPEAISTSVTHHPQIEVEPPFSPTVQSPPSSISQTAVPEESTVKESNIDRDTEIPTVQTELRRSTRVKHTPGHLSDFITDF